MLNMFVGSEIIKVNVVWTLSFTHYLADNIHFAVYTRLFVFTCVK